MMERGAVPQEGILGNRLLRVLCLNFFFFFFFFPPSFVRPFRWESVFGGGSGGTVGVGKDRKQGLQATGTENCVFCGEREKNLWDF